MSGKGESASEAHHDEHAVDGSGDGGVVVAAVLVAGASCGVKRQLRAGNRRAQRSAELRQQGRKGC